MGKPKLEWVRNIEFTEPEQDVIVEMVTFFNDMGWINESTQDAYDTLVEKVCNDSPFEWSCQQLDSLSEGKDQ
jgi:hypothetical protein